MAKVTAEIVAQIMGLAAMNSNRQISEILSKQGINLTHVTIGKIIKENRQERTEATKETINEHIKQTVTTDLDILQNTRDKLYNWFKDDNLRISERLMCLDRLTKVIDTRLKYSGASEPDKPDDKFDQMTDEELEKWISANS
ncbi:MAG: hypothetical protein H6Q72_948 [Firmicutes bacterium]|nr:hypothetical protein [Bacillota bacterium]